MTFPVVVTSYENQFAAVLAGVPEVRVFGATREKAIEAMRSEVRQRVARGELMSLEVDPLGITGLAGKYAADPTLRKIAAEAYQARDAEGCQ